MTTRSHGGLTPLRIGMVQLALLTLPGLVNAQTASVDFDNSVAVYGSGIFPALTQVRVCGDFRVLVAYINGTDLLFVDEVVSTEGGSTFRVERSFGFVEFNHYEASRSVSDVACSFRDSETLEIRGDGNDGHRNEDIEFTVVLNTRTGEYLYSETLERSGT